MEKFSQKQLDCLLRLASPANFFDNSGAVIDNGKNYRTIASLKKRGFVEYFYIPGHGYATGLTDKGRETTLEFVYKFKKSSPKALVNSNNVHQIISYLTGGFELTDLSDQSIAVNKNVLRLYAGSSKFDPSNGAALIVSNSRAKAKSLVAGYMDFLGIDGWTDIQLTRMPFDPDVFLLADQEKLKAGIPHIVVRPVVCEACNTWGVGLTKEGMCRWCDKWPGEKLSKLLIRDENNTKNKT